MCVSEGHTVAEVLDRAAGRQELQQQEQLPNLYLDKAMRQRVRQQRLWMAGWCSRRSSTPAQGGVIISGDAYIFVGPRLAG